MFCAHFFRYTFFAIVFTYVFCALTFTTQLLPLRQLKVFHHIYSCYIDHFAIFAFISLSIQNSRGRCSVLAISLYLTHLIYLLIKQFLHLPSYCTSQIEIFVSPLRYNILNKIFRALSYKSFNTIYVNHFFTILSQNQKALKDGETPSNRETCY